MVIVLERSISNGDKERVRAYLASRGFQVREIVGEQETIFGAVGIVPVDAREVELLPGVARVIPITSPYKLASREFRREDSVIAVGPVRIGGPRIVVIAGPCAVESREQVLESAALVRESGAVLFRAGAFKPRTSPYAFQGLGEEGLRYLKEAGERYGMPVVSEIVSPEHADMLRDYVDVLQIGARNMQNFELLKRVGGLGRPVLLKRGFAATIEDLLMSAEYLLAAGTDQVILCERGIRTFETATRNTLDLSAIPVVKKLSHLPIIVDPSHGTGLRAKVSPMALAAVAAGADGITVEVHPDPDRALSDGPQSLYPAQFEKLMRDIEALAPVLGKEVARLPVPDDRASRGGAGVAGRPARPAALGGPARVAFQGERGAFSEHAAHLHFAAEVETVAEPDFREVFEAVLRPGPVGHRARGELPHRLDPPELRPAAAVPRRAHRRRAEDPHRAQPDRVPRDRDRGHPPGLLAPAGARAVRGVPRRAPGWERVSWDDTAGAVRHVAEAGDRANAAIASEEAARVHGLAVLHQAIETNPQNYTRFVVIERDTGGEGEPAPASGRPGSPTRRRSASPPPTGRARSSPPSGCWPSAA